LILNDRFMAEVEDEARANVAAGLVAVSHPPVTTNERER
jgi:hypothetical protein